MASSQLAVGEISQAATSLKSVFFRLVGSGWLAVHGVVQVRSSFQWFLVTTVDDHFDVVSHHLAPTCSKVSTVLGAGRFQLVKACSVDSTFH